jgi:antitoxin component of MazEF toxin-antitoxin module
MSHSIVGRWGKNLAIRFPGDVVRAAGIRAGDQVEIEARGGEVLIRRVVPKVTLDEMFRGRSAAEWRAEYAWAFDWGPDVGREVVE